MGEEVISEVNLIIFVVCKLVLLPPLSLLCCYHAKTADGDNVQLITLCGTFIRLILLLNKIPFLLFEEEADRGKTDRQNRYELLNGTLNLCNMQ